MSEELKNCPFCGSDDVAKYGPKNDCFIECQECGLAVDNCSVKIWNARHIPEGFALVPIEPTGAMLKTGWSEVFSDWNGAEEDLIDIYRAMIAAYKEGK